MTAASTPRCSECVIAGSTSSARRERERVTRTTSRSPMRREANCEVPPCSLPEQRRISVFPQYSTRDRKSTRLNSSHGYISYAVFCLKKKTDEVGDLHLSETTLADAGAPS